MSEEITPVNFCNR